MSFPAIHRVVTGHDADGQAIPGLGPLTLPPPQAGTRVRFVDIPPDTAEFLAHGATRMKEAFTQAGDTAASTVKRGSPHPLMHRTESVDYGVVIEGEITLVLDDSEVLLKPGSVVIQRGTNHAWANPAACCSCCWGACTALHWPTPSRYAEYRPGRHRPLHTDSRS